jgi:DNA (cytosine-5)-methyltransferase 1
MSLVKITVKTVIATVNRKLSFRPGAGRIEEMKPKLLDLFCCAGGAGMGYYKAGFDVTGVDIKPQPNYPFKFIQADALTFDLLGYAAIHASPPCQEYSVSFNTMSKFSDNRYPKLLRQTRERLISASVPYVIENVLGAKYKSNQADGLQAHYLCGTMFNKEFHRHRLFETSFFWLSPGKCRGRVKAGYGTGIVNRTMTLCHNSKAIVQAAAQQFEIDWMKQSELTEAIPPAYTEFIGKYLMAEVLRLSEVSHA